MITKNKIIYIIGGGVSGLTAANYLEANGLSCTIIEATDRVGGRVKTDILKGYQLDHGFQVLLTAYPLAKKYLDYDKLELQKLLPGSLIYKSSNKKGIIGDPLRDLSMLWKTIFSDLATLNDKILIFKLSNNLKKESLDAIFSKEDICTIEYLNNYGFSDKVISNFFKPFFSGIFLEDNLNSSSIMFEFIFKMFSEGFAAIPKLGMKAIPEQLKNNLKQTKFIFNKKVLSINDGLIKLNNENQLKYDFVINTTEYDFYNKTNDSVIWNSCENLYFEVNKFSHSKPIIGLIANPNSLVNNIFCTTSIDTVNSGKKDLISVTIVKKHLLSENELINKIKEELEFYCKFKDIVFLKKYNIKKALLVKENIGYGNEIIQNDKNIYNAGDVKSNPSLNAAMLSGETAAKMIVKCINKLI